ncbi:MAG: endolytic transglycosylase MltG [Chloroflexota bacterium]|nr:endolytic transglycosylase MltG [Dehalococcoidia bacterium]MDW8252595.1 endolytic transglycosylase MltG [Chloroflexota bacterium]
MGRVIAGGIVIAALSFCACLAAALGPLLASEAGRSAVIDLLDRPAALDPTPIAFTVEPGDDAGTIARRLKEQGLIGDERLFRYLASATGLGVAIQVGQYELRRDMTSRAILEKLARGEVLLRTFTVPEGWQALQIVEGLEKQGVGDRAALSAALAQLTASPPPGTLAAARPPGQSLEGYLFPETYRLARDATPIEALTLMLRQLDEAFTPELRAAVAARGLTPHQALTLASIVEREAVKAEEQPIIAAVFLNRLRLGMPLQADPTVQFALALDPVRRARDGYWKKDLTVEDLAIDSPYNTYRVPGLPPGPICSPGLGALRAVAKPAEVDYLYFVARPDGSHAFARTLAEHNANVARYQR